MVQRHDATGIVTREDGGLILYADYKQDISALESILRRIINDLPTNRDWLDPELEKAARDILKGEGDGAEICV